MTQEEATAVARIIAESDCGDFGDDPRVDGMVAELNAARLGFLFEVGERPAGNHLFAPRIVTATPTTKELGR